MKTGTIRSFDRVVMETSHGPIIAEIFTKQAPITAGNFLRYVDQGHYRDATFYRANRPDNDEREPKIRIVQGGIDPTCQKAPLPPIEHESSAATGLTHADGTLSAVRWKPGTAASEFFIVLGDMPELDFGGSRNPDKQGYAVFGQVVSGMELVRRINDSPCGSHPTIEFLKDQALIPPVRMRIARMD